MAEGLHLVHALHRRHAGLVEGHGKQDVAQQGQGDAHGTDDEVFPGGFQRLLVAVEVDEGRAGQGGDLDAHPQGAQMARGGDQRHGREEEAQAGREAAFRGIGEGPAVQDAGTFGDPGLVAQVAHAVDRGHQKEHAGQHEEERAQRVRRQQTGQGLRMQAAASLRERAVCSTAVSRSRPRQTVVLPSSSMSSPAHRGANSRHSSMVAP